MCEGGRERVERYVCVCRRGGRGKKRPLIVGHFNSISLSILIRTHSISDYMQTIMQAYGTPKLLHVSDTCLHTLPTAQ